MVSNYEDLRSKFDETWQKHHELNSEFEKLKIEMQDEALKEVLKDKLLSSVEWRFERRGFRGGVSIEGDTKKIKDKAAYERLEKMFHTDYHCQTHLSFNARLRWDDGELTINFDSFDDLRSFCKEHGFNKYRQEFSPHNGLSRRMRRRSIGGQMNCRQIKILAHFGSLCISSVFPVERHQRL
jgi:hypothetical protein